MCKRDGSGTNVYVFLHGSPHKLRCIPHYSRSFPHLSRASFHMRCHGRRQLLGKVSEIVLLGRRQRGSKALSLLWLLWGWHAAKCLFHHDISILATWSLTGCQKKRTFFSYFRKKATKQLCFISVISVIKFCLEQQQNWTKWHEEGQEDISWKI